MKIIQLYYQGNFRYLLFQVDEQWYLIDRRPSYFIAYLVIPLNWFFYHKVYPITTAEYLKIKEKHSGASKFVIPTSLVGGMVVLLGAWMRVNNIDIFEYFNVNFSLTIKKVLLFISLCSSYLLLQFFYFSRKKKIQTMLGKNLDSPLLYKVRPKKMSQLFFKILGLQIFGLGIAILFVLTFLYLGNMAMLMGSVLMVLISLGIANGSLYPNEQWKYQIIDVLPNVSKK